LWSLPCTSGQRASTIKPRRSSWRGTVAQEFYQADKPYLKIAGAIESCQKLYKGDGGRFTHVEINDYLGFFSDLGLLQQRGAN
jgi:hypothetical protein